MGKLVSGRQALVVGAVCLAVLFLWPRLGTMGAKVPSSLAAVIVGMTMVYAAAKTRKGNLIDALKQESL